MTAAALALSLALAQPLAGAAPADPARQTAVATDRLFTQDDLLWVEVQLAGQTLADMMDLYSSRAGAFLPLGQFARLLDLAVTVLPSERRAEGWILSPDRRLDVDMDGLTATIAGRSVPFDRTQARMHEGELYLRADLIERLLPVRLTLDARAQFLTVEATQPLPAQQRLARSQRGADLATGGTESRVNRVETPYRLFTAPSLDVTLGGQLTRDGVERSRQYGLRAGGDLLFAGFRGSVTSDERGRVNAVRMVLERKDPAGHALGPLGGVRVAAGDIFTPSAALGPASIGGRGISYSSAPLETVDFATPLTLRGALPPGEEVELYVNEVLRAARSTTLDGQYEFADVPLALGLNTIRLVFYGSHGERRELVRRINLGAAQVEPGRLVLRAGVAEQQRPVIGAGWRPLLPGDGALRAVAVADYGIGTGFSMSGGLARYTPPGQTARNALMAGLRGYWSGLAWQGDIVLDDRGGRGASVGFAARPHDISLVARHAEYVGGFIDEARQLNIFQYVPLDRVTELRAIAGLRIAQGRTIPVTFDLRRQERTDGTTLLETSLRASSPLGPFYLSGTLDFERDSALVRPDDLRIGAELSTLVSRRLQLRAGLSYRLRPVREIDGAYVSADFDVSDRQALHLGVARSAGRRTDLSWQASYLFRARWFDVGATSSYEGRSGNWGFGLQLAFSLQPDPLSNRYRLERPGAAGGGAVAIDAFVDENGDNVRQPGEAPVHGVVLATPVGRAITDDAGHATVVGLGDAGAERLGIDLEHADDPFLAGARQSLEIVPRAGRVLTLPIPLRRAAEVAFTAYFTDADAAPRPLAALDLQVVTEDGAVVATGRTDHAGNLVIGGVPPGRFHLRVDPAQGERLGLRLAAPTPVIVGPAGGFMAGGDLFVARGARL